MATYSIVAFVLKKYYNCMLTFLLSQNGVCGGVLGLLKQIHNNGGLHAGVKKTFARVRTYADCIKLAGLFGQ